MKIMQGRDRIVILIPSLGITIKIARIDFFQGLRRLFIEPLYYKSFKLYFHFFTHQLIWDSRCLDSFRNSWFHGTNANWQEFIFYARKRHLILQPTYFSFFGLFNIQKIAVHPLITKSDPYCQFAILCKKAQGKHHFDNPSNFCLEDNHLKFLDYGDKEVQTVVIEFGDAIYREFDPDWDYEEYKKRREQSS